MSAENRDPRTEPGIGPILERTRQGKGLSLREVEQRTRIRSRYLRDLEREDFDVLPAVYVLGSLKTYADFLGLDGAALSRQLKARLTELEEPDAPAATPGDIRDENEFEAAPGPSVGFDQLFIGMGVVLISILAIMTFAAAVAQGDRSPVSQVDKPSTPEPPPEVALAGNTQDGAGVPEKAPDGTASDGTATDKGDGPENDPETSRDEERGGGGGREASGAGSIFGDAEFVPMSPSSPPAGPSSVTAAASPSASAAPEAAKPKDRRSSPAPDAADASPRPAGDDPGAASASPRPNAGAPAPAPAEPGGAGQPPASGAGPIPVEAARRIDEAFRLTGPD